MTSLFSSALFSMELGTPSSQNVSTREQDSAGCLFANLQEHSAFKPHASNIVIMLKKAGTSSAFVKELDLYFNKQNPDLLQQKEIVDSLLHELSTYYNTLNRDFAFLSFSSFNTPHAIPFIRKTLASPEKVSLTIGILFDIVKSGDKTKIPEMEEYLTIESTYAAEGAPNLFSSALSDIIMLYKNADFEFIKPFLNSEYNVDLNARSNGNTPLLSASLRGRTDIAEALINNKANLNLKSNWGGETALHMATVRKHSSIVKQLIRAGADISIKDNNGRTALEMAIKGSAIYNLLKETTKNQHRSAKSKSCRINKTST